jgi:hypothetical protein
MSFALIDWKMERRAFFPLRRFGDDVLFSFWVAILKELP